MYAGALDALIPLMLLALVPVHIWVAPDLRYTAGQGTVHVWSLSLWVGYYALYSLLSHWRWGKTLGKWVFRLSVVRMDGSDCTRSTLFGREFFRGASLAVLSIPLVLMLPFYSTEGGWGLGVLSVLYVLLGAPIVTAAIICPILSGNRSIHDTAADTMVIGVTREAAEPSAYPMQDMQGAVLFFIGAPALIAAAMLSPNMITFLGVLVVSVLGFAVVRALYERSQR